ncbi:MAG: YfhO family protein [Thermomicrobiales bacterium]
MKFAGLMGPGAMLVIVGLWLALLLAANLPRVRRRWPGARGEVGMLGLLTVVFLLFFWRLLFEQGVAIPKGGGDFNSFYYPLSAFAANQIHAGHFPLWNPFLYTGAPFAADYQAGALYPPNLLVWAVARPFTYGVFEALAIFHVWWASVTMYGFARTLGLRRASSLIAGITFAYGGFMTAQIGHAPMIAVASWLPAVLAALYRARNGSIGWTVVAGLGLTMATLAGHPQVLLYVITAALAYGIFLAWADRPIVASPAVDGEDRAIRTAATPPDPRRRWNRRPALLADPVARHWTHAAFRLAVMLVIAVGLAAPLLLPAEQLSRRSVRAGIGYENATQFSMQPVALLQLVLPKVFGDNPTNYWGAFANGEIWGYAGVVALVLAVIGVGWRIRAGSGQKCFFVALGGIALLAALGPFTPLHGWLYGFVPGYDRVRAAGRLLLLYDFAVAILAGWGLDTLLDWLAVNRPAGVELGAILRHVRRGVGIVVAVLALGIIPLFYSLILRQDDPVNRPVIAVDGLNLLLLVLLGALALVWAVERRGIGSRATAALVTALVIFDLFSATIGFNPTTDNVLAGFQQPAAQRELIARAANNPPFRVDTDDISDRWQPSLAAIDGIESVSGTYNPLQLADYAALRERAQSSRSSALYGLLNVAYVGLPAEKPAPADWQKAFTGDKVVFYQPSRPPLPRAFVVGTAQSVPDPGVAFDRIKAPDFDPTKIVYLQGSVTATTADPAASSATVTRDGTDGVTVRVTTANAGYLVLSDAYFPGWQATVDGHAATVLQADLAFRAVFLPGGGDHTIVFRFRPPWWAIGWGLAGLTALGTIALLVVTPVMRRRRR